MDELKDLETALLDAHARHDLQALAALYTAAGDEAEARDDIDAACFFLTQAMVFALECGADVADHLRSRLQAHGREAPEGRAGATVDSSG